MKNDSAEGINPCSCQQITPAAAGESSGACYVCGRELKAELVYIGKGLYRHESCFPGSLRWINSAVGRASVLRPILFKSHKEDEQ